MTNKEVARRFTDLAAIMELHDENPFKIKTYQNAYITLRKLDKPLTEMPRAEIDTIKGVGRAIGDKIEELLKTGTMQTYQTYADKTPSGVVDMLRIKGFGPKKIQAVWKELEIETVGELLYACNENRLIELHGFGKKTQDEIRKNTEYYLRSRHKLHWATADEMTEGVISLIKNSKLAVERIERMGEMRRLLPVVEKIELLVSQTDNLEQLFDNEQLILIDKKESADEIVYSAKTETDFPVFICAVALEDFGSKLFKYSGSREFLDAFLSHTKTLETANNSQQTTHNSQLTTHNSQLTTHNSQLTTHNSPNTEGGYFKHLSDEKMIFERAQLPFIPAELRDTAAIVATAQANSLPNLITLGDIKGVIHTHTTYSDGLHTIHEMASAAQHLGYQYIGISDHSKAAFYANGLKEDRVLEQWTEIDRLNAGFFNFKILKSTECDILNDGSLDYSDDLLRGFDFVIASVHTNLKMPEEKATARLIKAVENPHTTILGHPTGRLLLSREGYPIDHKKVIDACAANGVAIELNANPYRLDLDWSWIPYARERGVFISINPDAHSTAGIHDIRFGVLTARKGGLDTEGCLNTRSVEDFLSFK